MSQMFRKLGVALIGATLISLLTLLPAAAWNGYGGGGYGSMSYSSGSYGSNYGSMGYMSMGSYGSCSYCSSYDSYFHVRTFTYRVRFGDTLTRIARRFHTSVGAILRVNPGIKDPDLIFAGMKIWVPFGFMPFYGTSYGGGSSYGGGGSMYGGSGSYGSSY